MRHERIQKIPRRPVGTVGAFFFFFLKSYKQINQLPLSVPGTSVVQFFAACCSARSGLSGPSVTVSHAVFPAEIPSTPCWQRSAVAESGNKKRKKKKKK